MLDNEYFKIEQENEPDNMKGFLESLLTHYEKFKNTKNNHKNKYELFYELCNGSMRNEHMLNQWANQNIGFLVDNIETLKSHPTLLDHPDEISFSNVSFCWKDVCLRKNIDPDYGCEKEIAKLLFLWICYYANVEYKTYRSYLFTRVLHNLVNFHYAIKYNTKPKGPVMRLKWDLTNKFEEILANERLFTAFMGSEIYSSPMRNIGFLN